MYKLPSFLLPFSQIAWCAGLALNLAVAAGAWAQAPGALVQVNLNYPFEGVCSGGQGVSTEIGVSCTAALPFDPSLLTRGSANARTSLPTVFNPSAPDTYQLARLGTAVFMEVQVVEQSTTTGYFNTSLVGSASARYTDYLRLTAVRPTTMTMSFGLGGFLEVDPIYKTTPGLGVEPLATSSYSLTAKSGIYDASAKEFAPSSTGTFAESTKVEYQQLTNSGLFPRTPGYDSGSLTFALGADFFANPLNTDIALNFDLISIVNAPLWVNDLNGGPGGYTANVRSNFFNTLTMLDIYAYDDLGNDITAQAVAGFASLESNAVFRLASPVIDTAQPVAFGNVREGAVVAAQAISITNDVPNDGFSEALNARAAGNTGGVLNNAGSFGLLAPGATNDAAIAVSIDTSTAGDKSGNATIDFESNGAGSSALGITALPSQDVGVTGAVFRPAEGIAYPFRIDFYARVGDTVGRSLAIENTALADGYSENLDARASASGNAFVTADPVLALAAGNSDNSTLNVTSDTGTAGVFSGQADVAFESNGQEWGLGNNIALGEQQIAVNTSVYAEAIASVTPAVNFGTVRVGISAASSVNVANTGAGALVDVLRETSRSVDAPFSVTPLTSDIAAGGSTTLDVGMDTSVAGVYSGEASMGFASHNDFLSDAILGVQKVAFSGTVNNLAAAAFMDVPDPAGHAVLSGAGKAFVLDFGTIFSSDLGVIFEDVLGVQNTASGPADLLAGTFSSLGSCAIFCLNGMTSFNDFFDIAVDDILDNLMVSLNTTSLGLGVYEDSIALSPFSTLSGFDDIALDPIMLTFRINVRESGGDVPLPGTLVLVATGVVVMFYRRRRQAPR